MSMVHFYKIGDDSYRLGGMPWISRMHAGWGMVSECDECKGMELRTFGDLTVSMDERRARLWPDVLGSGAGQFVVSSRLLEAMRMEDMRIEIGGSVRIMEPIHNRLSLEEAPEYFWIDGDRHRAARMDFEATGYVDAYRCGACDRLLFDVAESRKRLHGDPAPPVIFEYDTPLGLDLFTTDFSPLAFYCTDRLFECVKRHKLTNVAFIPTERGIYGHPIG